MMLATRFRQVLSGICTSLAGLSFAPEPAALATTTPPTLLSRSPRRAHQTNRFRIGSFNVQSLGPNHRHVRHHDDELQLLSEAQRAHQLRIYNGCAANTIEIRAARNKILHQLRARCRAIASRKLDERITRIENLSDSARIGFRKHRSTADAVWAHKWLCARVQRYRETIHVLGIDLSRAFDTIDRVKLVEVLQTFLHNDEVRLIKVLLADTKLSLRSGSKAQHSFDSNIGTPQ
ncbi:hypothetical protein PHYSODRAFT_418173, partial [Phytophthora sojae]